MSDPLQAGGDEVKRLLQEAQAQTNPAPEAKAEGTQEAKPEAKNEQPKDEPKEKEEPKGEPEEKEQKPIEEKTSKLPKDQVPVIKYIQEEKRRKQAEKELAELKAQMEKGTTPQAADDAEEALYKAALEGKWTQEEYEKELFKLRAVYAPIKAKLEELKGYEETAKKDKEQKEIESYVAEEVDNLSKEIAKDHGDNADVIKLRLKEKIIKEGLITTPAMLVYKGFDEFRPPPKNKTFESPKSGKTEVFDENNPTPEDIRSGRVDGMGWFKKMAEKHN